MGLKTAFSAWVSLGPGSVSSDAGLGGCEWTDLLGLGRNQAKPEAGSSLCFEVLGEVIEAVVLPLEEILVLPFQPHSHKSYIFLSPIPPPSRMQGVSERSYLEQIGFSINCSHVFLCDLGMEPQKGLGFS